MKKPLYLIKFMEFHGYRYDPKTDQFIKPEDVSLWDVFQGEVFGNNEGRNNQWFQNN